MAKCEKPICPGVEAGNVCKACGAPYESLLLGGSPAELVDTRPPEAEGQDEARREGVITAELDVSRAEAIQAEAELRRELDVATKEGEAYRADAAAVTAELGKATAELNQALARIAELEGRLTAHGIDVPPEPEPASEPGFTRTGPTPEPDKKSGVENLAKPTEGPPLQK